MADQLHFNIRDFRDILLAEIAKLEHGVRETIVNNGAVSAQRAGTIVSAGADTDALTLKHEREVKKLRKEIADLNEQLETCQQKSVDKGLVANLETEVEKLNRAIKKMVQEQIASENHYKSEVARLEGESKVLQATAEANHKSALEEKGRADALEKAYAELQKKCAELEATAAQAVPKTVAHPLLGKIQEQPPIVTKKEELDEEEEEADAESEGIDPDSLPDFKHKGVIYKKDADGTLYKDSEEGWELVGQWDEKTKTIIIQEIEEEAEAEEDDENNLTEFVFKGKTYFLDEENNVFQETDDGYEQVGKWNGKKILLE
jgi:hypothetical protein